MIEKEESIKKKKLKNTKHGRNKNGFSTRPLTLLEFQKFIGLMFASVTRIESGVNLWKYTNSSSHFFYSPADFGRFMSRHHFKKIRKYFDFCFSETEQSIQDP